MHKQSGLLRAGRAPALAERPSRPAAGMKCLGSPEPHELGQPQDVVGVTWESEPDPDDNSPFTQRALGGPGLAHHDGQFC